MSPNSILPAWFEHAIGALQAGDIEGWMAIYTPDAVHEFPFAPEGTPRALVGRDAIADYMRRLPSLIRFGSFSDVRVRQAGDELIIEATGNHRRIADDAARELSYIWFITLKDGKVSRLHEPASAFARDRWMIAQGVGFSTPAR